MLRNAIFNTTSMTSLFLGHIGKSKSLSWDGLNFYVVIFTYLSFYFVIFYLALRQCLVLKGPES